MNDEYYRQKYLKYKTKYLELQEQIGGIPLFNKTKNNKGKQKREKQKREELKREEQNKREDENKRILEDNNIRKTIIEYLDHKNKFPDTDYKTYTINYTGISKKKLEELGTIIQERNNTYFIFNKIESDFNLITIYFPKFNTEIKEINQLLEHLKSFVYFPILTKNEYNKLNQSDKDNYKNICGEEVEDTTPCFKLNDSKLAFSLKN